MIDELRVKCPSCGILLDVRNSKHEAVKHIACPNCKKQLAIDFQEHQEPVAIPVPVEALYDGQRRIELHEGVNQHVHPECKHLEINVVRLNNGNCKYIVKALSADHRVLLNGQPLEQDDLIVLSVGDTLQEESTILSFGNPVLSHKPEPDSESESKPEPVPTPTPPALPKKPRHLYWWLAAIVALATALVTAIILWPTNEGTKPALQLAEDEIDVIVSPDTADDGRENQGEERTVSPVHEHINTPRPATTPPPPPSLTALSDYELEIEAGKGNIEAQYLLGKRLVSRSDSTSIVKGINYLNRAARNGSSDAVQAINRVFNALEQKAANGSSTAENILNAFQR